jgi:Flp pilus assembly protein TadG
MMTSLKKLLRRLGRDQRGAVFVIAAAATVMIIGFGAVLVDLGNGYLVQRKLQNAADAAALAGATTLYNGGSSSSAVTAATSWSASSGDKNALSNVTVNTQVTPMTCTGGTGKTCTATPSGSNPNAVMVSETGSVSTFFGGLLGFPTLGASATSYAIGLTDDCTSNCSGLVNTADVMIIVDTTQSMQDLAVSASDPACAGLTNVQCAMVGVQQLLTSLTPPSNGVGGATVGLMTFPGLKTAAEAAMEYCSGGTPSSGNIAQYNATPTTADYYNAPYYLIYPTYASLTAGGGLDGNYATSQGKLNTSDPLVIAAYGSKTCNGLTAFGGAGTFYAIAIQEATNILTTYGRSGAAKYIVFLSDGDANNSDSNMPKGYSISNSSVGTFTDTSSSGNFNECHQGIAASLNAQAAGITVIIMGYGEETTNASSASPACQTDTGTYLISPCTTMEAMASPGNGSGGYPLPASPSPQFFYSDANSTGANACPSPANPTFTSVNDIFQAIGNVVAGGKGTTTNVGTLPHLIPAS